LALAFETHDAASAREKRQEINVTLCGLVDDKTRFFSKTAINFSSSRNVPLDFQFYPNLESGTFRSGYNGTSSTTFWTPNHEAMAEACSVHQQKGTD
jgi:hypothetical protein